MVQLSLQNTFRTYIYKILHYDLNINQHHTQILQNLLYLYPKITLTSHTSTGLFSKTQIRLKPNSSKIAHFPIKNYYDLHFTTTSQNQFFPTFPHIYFSTKFCITFNFIEVFTDDKPDISATIIQNSTNHIATLPTGHIGYIDVQITNEKPKYYQVKDINTLIHNVKHTYHPDVTELVSPTNYAVQPNDITVPAHQFSLHQLYMTDPTPSIIPSSINNVQPTSHASKPRIFPSLQTLQKIVNSLTNSTSNFLTFQTLNLLHFLPYFFKKKLAMQHTKLMLAKLLLHSVLDLYQVLNFLHNAIPKYLFIIEIN